MLERVAALRGMDRLLPVLPPDPPCHLVGGAVRDVLRGEAAQVVDLDGCVDGDAHALAGELAERLSGQAVLHEAFGTATVNAPGLCFDIARTRRERYERPGALPVVEPAPLEEDLGRRDFTVNAMAVALSGERAGELIDPLGGRADLEARVVRVLHLASFEDDPTRLLRAVRYEARLGAAMDPDTEELARAAIDGGAMTTVSGARVRDELLDLLCERELAAAARRLADLSLDRALHPKLRADPGLIARSVATARALATEHSTGSRSVDGVPAPGPDSALRAADPAMAGLAALLLSAPAELTGWLDGLGLPAGDRGRALHAARRAPELVEALREELRPSALHGLLRGEPAEALALVLALGAPQAPIRRYLTQLRGVRLEITGSDLIAAGVPPSPRLGRALEATLRRKLDGELSGRPDELRSALEIARAPE